MSGYELRRRVRVHALSPRELAVLKQVARGRTNSQIAKALGISDKTVRNHLSRIFLKLSASNRAHAVLKAIVAGVPIVDADDPGESVKTKA